MNIEYRVWCENGDLIEYDIEDQLNAHRILGQTVRQHVKETGCEGCGVIHSHGYFIQYIEDEYSIACYGL